MVATSGVAITGITQNWSQFSSWDMPNYTEIQVPGANRYRWVKINVNTRNPRVFSYEFGPVPRTYV